MKCVDFLLHKYKTKGINAHLKIMSVSVYMCVSFYRSCDGSLVFISVAPPDGDGRHIWPVSTATAGITHCSCPPFARRYYCVSPLPRFVFFFYICNPLRSSECKPGKRQSAAAAAVAVAEMARELPNVICDFTGREGFSVIKSQLRSGN